MNILFVYPNISGSTLVPINIPILNAIAKEKGCNTALFDCTWYSPEQLGQFDFEKKKEELLQVTPFERSIEWKKTNIFEDFKNKIKEFKPDLIAISIVEDVIPLSLKLLEHNTSVPVVAGGVGANYNYEKLLSSELINWICKGEGEICFSEIIDCFNENRVVDIDKLNNIITLLKTNKTNFKYCFKINKLNKPIDINSLPCPDFSVFGEDRITRIMNGKEYKMLNYELDRGCPYSCTYCCASSLKETYMVEGHKGYYRQKDNNKIIQDLLFLKEKHNPNYIDFSSETFLARSYSNLKEFFIRYKKEINIPFWCQSRPETLTKQKVMLLKDSGCSDFQLGIEHGNEEFRKKWLKRTGTNKQILSACHLLEEFKIPYTVNCIIGFPDEKRNHINDTIDLCRQINPKNYNCYIMNPYKGTWLYDYCIENNLLDPEAESMQVLGGKDIKYKHYNRITLLGIQRCFSFYCRFPKEMFREIWEAEQNDEKFNTLRKKYLKEYYGR